MAEPSLKELLATSTLAFSGTVTATGTTPVAGLEADERTALVRVDEALHAPAALDLAQGASVTVQLSPGLPPLAAGERATFFADPLVYGDSLAVAEVGRTGPERVAPRAAAARDDELPVAPVERALGELQQDRVLDHARAADAVVRAHVVGLHAAQREAGVRDEHDPHWWIATLHADLVERGEVPGVGEGGGEIRVLYANSVDVRWRRWPKPKAGQAGMWILHRTEGDQAALAPFLLRHPEDLQPSLQLDLLREEGTR